MIYIYIIFIEYKFCSKFFFTKKKVYSCVEGVEIIFIFYFYYKRINDFKEFKDLDWYILGFKEKVEFLIYWIVFFLYIYLSFNYLNKFYNIEYFERVEIFYGIYCFVIVC